MMIQLIIGLVVLVCVVTAGAVWWDNFKDGIAAPYIQAQIVQDQAVINAAKKAQTDAEAERDNARADTASCTATLGTQKQGIDAWKATAERNAKVAKDAKAQAELDAKAAEPKIADLRAQAAAAPKLMACTEELGKAKEILRQSLCARRGVTCPPEPAKPAPK